MPRSPPQFDPRDQIERSAGGRFPINRNAADQSWNRKRLSEISACCRFDRVRGRQPPGQRHVKLPPVQHIRVTEAGDVGSAAIIQPDRPARDLMCRLRDPMVIQIDDALVRKRLQVQRGRWCGDCEKSIKLRHRQFRSGEWRDFASQRAYIIDKAIKSMRQYHRWFQRSVKPIATGRCRYVKQPRHIRLGANGLQFRIAPKPMCAGVPEHIIAIGRVIYRNAGHGSSVGFVCITGVYSSSAPPGKPALAHCSAAPVMAVLRTYRWTINSMTTSCA
jgi:hypothetical protein